MGFKNDLQFGKKYEGISMGFNNFDRIVLAPPRQFKDWDYYTVTGDKKTSYEVKSDKLSYKTGNLAIEFQCNKKASGLTATKADYWYYFVVDSKNKYEVYKFPVDELKQLVLRENCRQVNGGDGWRARMYLLKKSKCSKYKIKPEKKVYKWRWIYSEVLESIDNLGRCD